MQVPSMSEIRRRLKHHDPVTTETEDLWAATALVLHDAEHGPEVLFIRRASRSGDPWSGHVALPGGRREGDETLPETAAREAYEEVGINLEEPIGRVGDVAGRTHGGGVATFVFEVSRRPDLDLETSEVAAAYWISLSSLTDEQAWTRHPIPGLGPFPGIQIGEDVLWGLTLRTMQNFFQMLGLDLR